MCLREHQTPPSRSLEGERRTTRLHSLDLTTEPPTACVGVPLRLVLVDAYRSISSTCGWDCASLSLSSSAGPPPAPEAPPLLEFV